LLIRTKDCVITDGLTVMVATERNLTTVNA
jgi:hypothetical protein